jgi:hypothetical protein
MLNEVLNKTTCAVLRRSGLYKVTFFCLLSLQCKSNTNIFLSLCRSAVALWPIFGSRPPQLSSSNSIYLVQLTSSFVHGAEQPHTSVHYSPTCYMVFLLSFFLHNFLLKSSLECCPCNITCPLEYVYLYIC